MAGVSSSFGGVRLDAIKLNEILRGPDGPVAKWALRQGDLVKDEAKRLVGVSKPDPVPRRKPRKPGNLRDHIVKRMVIRGDRLVVIVGADVPYAMYHHKGFGPFDIFAKSPKKPLVFYWHNAPMELGGPGVYYFLRVHHPGFKGNPFLTNALRVIER